MFNHWKYEIIDRYGEFSGRTSRPGYWWTALAGTLIWLPPYLLFLATRSWFFLVVWIVAVLALFIPGVAVAVRRLHDTGRSGWSYLLGLIPCVGPIVLIVLLAQEGQRIPNDYGRPPPVLR